MSNINESQFSWEYQAKSYGKQLWVNSGSRTVKASVGVSSFHKLRGKEINRTSVDNQGLSQRQLYEDWWVLKVSGVALNLLFVGGIVIMLSQIDGNRLDKWNFFFQPNAIVSTFVVVAETTMLVAVSESLSQLKWLYFSGGRRSIGDFEAFNGASSGPWGALSFFWRMRLKVPFALVGSVVMIFPLAMGPFAQQIISLPVRYVQSVDEVAAINVTNHSTRGKPFSLLEIEANAFMKRINRRKSAWPQHFTMVSLRKARPSTLYVHWQIVHGTHSTLSDYATNVEPLPLVLSGAKSIVRTLTQPLSWMAKLVPST